MENVTQNWLGITPNHPRRYANHPRITPESPLQTIIQDQAGYAPDALCDIARRGRIYFSFFFEPDKCQAQNMKHGNTSTQQLFNVTILFSHRTRVSFLRAVLPTGEDRAPPQGGRSSNGPGTPFGGSCLCPEGPDSRQLTIAEIGVGCGARC